MSQSLNLAVSGLYTSLNDYNGLPPGALDVADNVESRYKNVLEPRRGFDSLVNSQIAATQFLRLTNFYVSGTNSIIGLTSAGSLVYYTGANPWPAVPGSYSTNLMAPDAVNAKCRFIQAGQNLYVTAQDGLRSLSSGSAAQTLRAGVPKGLNLLGVTDGSSTGFLNNNVVKSTTGNITSGSAILSQVVDSTGVIVGQYVSGTGIPVGAKVFSITAQTTLISQTGNTTAGSTTISNLASNTGITAGVLVSGLGIPSGTKVVSISGAGPYAIVVDTASYQTATGVTLTFTAPIVITLDQNATATTASTSIKFYSGSQVAYRMVFGRVETDINNGTVTRLGTPSSSSIVTNISATTTNTNVTGTLPKNSVNQITFVQLYRSQQTASTLISPLDQYNLVYERKLTASDFTARTVTINDTVPDSLVGIPLYTGSDQQGITQANDPPPMCWDMCKFREFTLFGNITRPSTLKVTILSVGAPSGIQIGDTITISGTFSGSAFSQVYTASAAENRASRQFLVASTGTPSQNIADTANSLIRVINYDNAVPVHVILLSGATDLPGQLLFEYDNPSLDTFTINASAHTAAYDPALSSLVSQVNTINNGIAVSKLGENEAVPALNLLRAGDTSSPVIRMIALRDYVIVLKGDGIYKIQGTAPNSLVSNPFDLTTKIIGADTAVSLNSGVWMLSNQGVVSISDGGVDAKSIPVDDLLNKLSGSFLDNLTNTAFAVGYESDRKYILCVPSGTNTYSDIQYCFNYVTHVWTTWSRNLYAGFIHSQQGKLYIARADASDQSVSQERKSGTYKDYVDEGIGNTITSVSGTTVGLTTLDQVSVGDILYQNSTHFSPILSLNATNNTVLIQNGLTFSTGSVSILKAYLCQVTWKQVFGDNPAFMRQFSEGIALFKNTRFNTAVARFVTDFSQNVADVPLIGTGNSLWGLFKWGQVTWGGTIIPSKIRFYIPQDKQIASYLIPSLRIQQGYSDFKFQGLAIAYHNISQEVGL